MTFDELFALKKVGADHWIAPSVPITDDPQLFGGVFIGQAIVAASVDTRTCHALHLFFLDAGAKEVPFNIAIQRTRTGRSFTTRHIEIKQNDKSVMVGYSSHHGGDHGPEQQISMPDVPPPERLEDDRLRRNKRLVELFQKSRRYLSTEMLDTRSVELPADTLNRNGTRRAIWFQSREPILGALDVHKAALGFASDLGLVRVGLQTHLKSGRLPLQTTSLDHSIWFHREVSCEAWMLQVLHAQITTQGRGLSQCAVFSRDGQLVATATQEFLARTKSEANLSKKEN